LRALPESANMPRYQITYSNNSKTQYLELHADNYELIKNLVSALIVGELLEIREIQHEDKTIIEDDKNYIHSANVKIYTNNRIYFNSFKIPKLKKTITDTELENYVISNIRLNGLIPEMLQITRNYKV
jgi:hypothetical protein